MTEPDSKVVKTNNRIRYAARGLANKEALATDDEIIKAVEAILHDTLNEHQQRIAVRAYIEQRNDYLREQDKALQRQQEAQA